MILYCIHTGEDDGVRLLRRSCEERGVDFMTVDPMTYDYTTRPSFVKDALLYRVSTTKAAADLEKFLLLHPAVNTFYTSSARALSSMSNILMYEKNDIPRPKTIYRLSKSRELLRKYAAHLGLPLIIKSLGGSHGIGVIKIDSLSSLFSAADYLLSKNSGVFVLKEFIQTTSSARLIVLGDKVIDSIKYSAPAYDFRSNEGATPNVSMEKFSKKIEEVAIAATRALEIEFAGVDILIDKDGAPHVAEVNFPCFFPRCQALTGADISGMMIDHLVCKSSTKR